MKLQEIDYRVKYLRPFQSRLIISCIESCIEMEFYWKAQRFVEKDGSVKQPCLLAIFMLRSRITIPSKRPCPLLSATAENKLRRKWISETMGLHSYFSKSPHPWGAPVLEAFARC